MDQVEYYYGSQLRAYRVQLIRAFSNFKVKFGTNPDGSTLLHRVPCRWGETSRLAETIINAGSENQMPSAPFISIYTTSMSLAPERRQAPSLVSTVNVNERDYDGKYLNTPGNRYTVKRYMPVPFNLTVNVDFWTSNLSQKEELFEQTQVLFNGMVDMQTSNNPLDWTLFSTIEPTNITWSSRTIPVGTENPIDVMTVEYKIPIWINPPALVEYQKLIEQVVTNINEGTYDPQRLEWNQGDLLTRIITTPNDARIGLTLVNDGVYEISLQNYGGTTDDEQSLPTQIAGSASPVMQPGASFLVNDVSITIPNNSVDDLIKVMRNSFQGKNLNVRLNLANKLELINLTGGDITLLNITGTPVEALGFVQTTYQGGTLAWWRLFELYGSITGYKPASPCDPASLPEGSELRLLRTSDLDNRTQDIVGFISMHPTNQNLIIWSVQQSTWPAATMPALTAVINPQTTYPGAGISQPQAGQRYLLVDEITPESVAWGELHATTNDIIQYDGTSWQRVFDSATTTAVQYVKNNYSQRWLKFDGTSWDHFPPNHYFPGEWRLRL